MLNHSFKKPRGEGFQVFKYFCHIVCLSLIGYIINPYLCGKEMFINIQKCFLVPSFSSVKPSYIKLYNFYLKAAFLLQNSLTKKSWLDIARYIVPLLRDFYMGKSFQCCHVIHLISTEPFHFMELFLK